MSSESFRVEQRALGSTRLGVSRVAFGAGPISQLLVGDDHPAQLATIAKALELGINWFDTAASYGNGQSEINLGRALAELGATRDVQIASKVRLMPGDLDTIGRSVRTSVVQSLRRLRLARLPLLQIHNSITHRAGDEPTSITPAHILSAGGVLEELDRLRSEGLVEHFGLTGLGASTALAEVIASGAFATLQVPYNLLNPSAGRSMAADFADTDYCDVITHCGRLGIGVFAIRVFAGGALVRQPPSPHTLTTPFFPLELYERNCQGAEELDARLAARMSLKEAAVRFALSHPHVTSIIVGFARPEEAAEVAEFAAAGPLDSQLLASLNEMANSSGN